MSVRDPMLAHQAVQIALSDEIPAQATSLRLPMILALTGYHASLAWKTFTEHSDALLKSYRRLPSAPLLVAQYYARRSGSGTRQPLDQLEDWIKAHVPAEMASNVARGIEAARFQLALKKAMVSATDSFLQAKSGTKPHQSAAERATLQAK